MLLLSDVTAHFTILFKDSWFLPLSMDLEALNRLIDINE
jgi:hypothetical protein